MLTPGLRSGDHVTASVQLYVTLFFFSSGPSQTVVCSKHIHHDSGIKESARLGSGFEQMLNSKLFLKVALASFREAGLWSIQMSTSGSLNMELSLLE